MRAAEDRDIVAAGGERGKGQRLGNGLIAAPAAGVELVTVIIHVLPGDVQRSRRAGRRRGRNIGDRDPTHHALENINLGVDGGGIGQGLEADRHRPGTDRERAAGVENRLRGDAGIGEAKGAGPGKNECDRVRAFLIGAGVYAVIGQLVGARRRQAERIGKSKGRVGETVIDRHRLRVLGQEIHLGLRGDIIDAVAIDGRAGKHEGGDGGVRVRRHIGISDSVGVGAEVDQVENVQIGVL